MKIALIREHKNPPDRRVALTPKQCVHLMSKFSEIQVVAESSPSRIFTDADYTNAGVSVVTNLDDCDVLLGIKEVPVDALVANKTYAFFSHTIKKQPHNKKLLPAVIQKNIRLIDYECLVWPKNHPSGKQGRILGFGFWAGVVGAYNAFLTFGKKYNLFTLKPAYECANYIELKSELTAIFPFIPNIRIGVTGTGRVAHGVLDMLSFIGIESVLPEDFITKKYDKPIFSNFHNEHIYTRVDDVNAPFDTSHFYENHAAYRGDFAKYIPHTDLLINGLYWEPSLDPLFTKEDTKRPDFTMRVIADISCDIEGSIPITMRDTYPKDPTIGWDPQLQKEVPPYGKNTIDIMAVSVLPSELPADASTDFGKSICDEIIPLLLLGDKDGILQNATIAEAGQLTSKYSYLSDYVASN